ncbi:hypothetical protein SCHPADRAFT_996174 [Schizopora paradoxa]|uniref:J domain-containing protein n=1 Tax=Schizopora paradoxa TaxID=27342 RepID=A0A0H2SDL4_9AGAM|nr:hypothetical protein SCHPADRAFT_996174 [Schizopora paradoxa]
MPIDPNLRVALNYLKDAQAARDVRDYAKARELCNKSIATFSIPEATKLLESIDVLDPQPEPHQVPPNVLSQNTAASDTRNPSARNTPHDAASIFTTIPGQFDAIIPSPSACTAAEDEDSGGEPSFTPPNPSEQSAEVKRILRCDESSYYDILGLTGDASVVEIEIAHRKLTSQLTLESNTVAGNALSLVSKAYEILSDEKRKALYDKGGNSTAMGYAELGYRNDRFSDLSMAVSNGARIVADGFGGQTVSYSAQMQMVMNAAKEQKAQQEQLLAKAMEKERASKALQEQLIARTVQEQKQVQEQLFAKVMEEQRIAKAKQEQMLANALREQQANQQQLLARAMKEQRIQKVKQEQMIANAVNERQAAQEKLLAQAMAEQRVANERQQQMIAKAVAEQKARQEQALANMMKEYGNAWSSSSSKSKSDWF